MNLNNQLIQASNDGDLSQVKSLIIEGADVHAWDDYVFIYAALNGHIEIVKYLVEDHDANVHLYGDLVLRIAASNGQLEVVKYLVEDCDADVHARDDYALQTAASNGQLEVVKYLVEDCDADVHARDDYALRWAADYGHLEIVKYLKTYNVSQFTNRHIDKQKRIENSNQVFKEIRALPGIGIDYLYAFEHFNHLKTIF